MMKRVSIRWRITLWNTAAFAVVLLGFGLLVYVLLRKTHYEQIDAKLRSQLARLVANEQEADSADQQVRRWIRGLSKQEDFHAIVFDSDNQVLAQSDIVSNSGLARPPAALPNHERFETLVLPELGHVRRFETTVAMASEKYTVVLLASLEHVDEELAEVVKALVVTVPATLLVAAALAYFLARKALSPVEHLRKLADEISAEHLDRRLPIANAADELGLLAQTINAMIGRLEASFNEIRRFTADASHELRTPIAVIRSEAEMAVETATNLDEAKERLSSILEECERLTTLTEHLLTLCREDAGITQLRSDKVLLDEVVSEAIEVMQPLAKGKDQTITVALEDTALVKGDSEKLRRVFYNLLDNAIKYTPQTGRIFVTQRASAGEVIVTVRDEGIGIPEKDLPHVFDRFYRGDAASARFPEGAGLGLSIVKSIVSAHGGRVEAETSLQGGAAFHVYLPMCSVPAVTSA